MLKNQVGHIEPEFPYRGDAIIQQGQRRERKIKEQRIHLKPLVFGKPKER